MSRVYSIIDIETTGGYRNGNKITEIAIINFDGLKIIDSYETLINPEINIPFTITKLTGIDNNMVAEAPRFFEVAKKIVEMTEGNIFVAHNVFFDYNFIKHEFKDLGYSFNREKICTVRLARKYLPGHKSYSLGKICRDLGISIKARHRAMGDASATVELLKLILSKQKDLSTDFSHTKKALIPDNVQRSEFEALPDKPGVYYFYSSDDELLYIGKSKNIKKRVSSHFRLDLKRKKDLELKALISRIDFKLLGNELAALLFECHEIKKLRPRFNIALRGVRTPISVILDKSKDIYRLRATSVERDTLSFYKFKNKKRASAFIDSIYKSFISSSPADLDFDVKLNNFLDKFGQELYNQLLTKSFEAPIPKKPDFIVTLPGRVKTESCNINVINFVPRNILFLNEGEITESIKLDDHADVQRIFFKYLLKFKIVIS